MVVHEAPLAGTFANTVWGLLSAEEGEEEASGPGLYMESPAGIQVAPESGVKMDSILHIHAWSKGGKCSPPTGLRVDCVPLKSSHTLTLQPCCVHQALTFLSRMVSSRCLPRSVWPSPGCGGDSGQVGQTESVLVDADRLLCTRQPTLLSLLARSSAEDAVSAEPGSCSSRDSQAEADWDKQRPLDPLDLRGDGSLEDWEGLMEHSRSV